MTLQDQREAARKFFYNWKDIGEEKQYSQKFWLDLLQNVYGVSDPYRYIDFEKTVHYSDGEKKLTDRFADGYIAETKVLIEQKSANIDLGAKQSGHNDKTPYEQAKEYNDNFRADDKVKWIILCNFKEFWIFNLNDEVPTPVKFSLKELPTKLSMLDFLVKKEVKKVADEEEVSKEAGDIIGNIYDELLLQYKNPEDPENLKSLNKLCVRLVFCLYAEDAGLFGKKDLFHDYLERFDVKRARKALKTLFEVLNQKIEDRDEYLEEDDELLAMFPYVNGGLFDEKIEIPPLTDELMKLILEKASENFDWSVISPTIFGSIFESTLNPDTRHERGMHYTSIENIHKVIDPLFMDDLYNEFEEIKGKSNAGGTRTKALNAFRDKLANLIFLDPACGSGNFLTESFISLRRLENEVLKELHLLSGGQNTLGIIPENEVYNLKNISKPKVSISQFYGIEINDFAVSVAKTALWIAEAQMMQETARITSISDAFFPLKTNAYIIENNALRINWGDVVPGGRIDYIMGNPPFYGARRKINEQKEDIKLVFGNNWNRSGDLDYVSCWFKKCADYIENKNVCAAFVATSSVVQGESVSILWERLFERGLKFVFAYKPFPWENESLRSARVECVIIGISYCERERYVVYEGDEKKILKHINPYFIDGEDVFLPNRTNPINNVPDLVFGSMPNDGGFYLLRPEQCKNLIKKAPECKKYIRQFMGADEFIKNKKRYCIWLKDADIRDVKQSKELMNRIDCVRRKRLASSRKATQKLADTPMLFGEIRQPEKGTYLLIPRVSSEKRKYIPIGFLNADIIASDATFIVPNAGLYHFGVITSNVHNAWMNTVAGKLEARYRYSKEIVYNNFPWPTPTEAQIKKIEQTAQGILDARALYPDLSLSDLYDINMMPKELLKAHQANDVAVMKAYGLTVKDTSKDDCVIFLFKLYKSIVEQK